MGRRTKKIRDPEVKSPSAGLVPSGSHRLTLILIAILALAIAISFGRVKNASFIELDDNAYVFGNPHVMPGLTIDNISWAWTTDYGGFWIPLTWMSLQLDATLSGPAKAIPPDQFARLPDATIYHLDNLLLHILAAALLFLFLSRATGARGLWPSFFATLLWAIHPLRVESVAWVTERKDVLSGVFGFAALYFYVIAGSNPNRRWKLATVTAMALSLLAKPAFVTLPLLLVLLDFWPLQRIRTWPDLARSFARKWLLFAISIAASAVTFLAERGAGALPGLGTLSVADRFFNVLLSYSHYLWMHIYCTDLAPFYPYVKAGRPAAVVSGVLLAVTTALCLWQRRNRPWLIVGWLWYVLAFLPMIGIVKVGDYGYADRFTYVPGVGLFLMLTFALPSQWLDSRRVKWAIAAAAAIASFFAFVTLMQVGYWRDSITLFNRTLEVTESNFTAHHELSQACLRNGRPDLAISHLQQALEINPRSLPSLMQLAALHMQSRRPDFALPLLKQAVEIAPQDTEVRNIYGSALGMTGRYDEALAEFKYILTISPHDAQALRNLEITTHLQTRAAATTQDRSPQ